jgi:hypothetical protein
METIFNILRIIRKKVIESLFPSIKKENMSNLNQIFHPKLLITNHFDDIVNQIDVKTESYLETLIKSKSWSKQKQNQLNKIREKQINLIQEVMQLNLNFLSRNEYEEKWSQIIDEISLDFQQEVDEIKEKLIHFDCILLEQPRNLNGFHLWITPWFCNNENLTFLK